MVDVKFRIFLFDFTERPLWTHPPWETLKIDNFDDSLAQYLLLLCQGFMQITNR